jgi:hypothetical protein
MRACRVRVGLWPRSWALAPICLSLAGGPLAPHAFADGHDPPPWLPFKGFMRYWWPKLSNPLFFNMPIPLVNDFQSEIFNLPPMIARQYWPLDWRMG